ncbi:hypothetical protein IQ276_039280 [Desmonostoc muscorum LEGE 12446]|uniref:Uncharacterized protein n=1 Tax=Desmonostoc muscorum LEGE 12446 TaxID=1828758 RepID=A0A8J7DE13_DESMC|nr:hypothetical protein [Desmonostoc muscorum]MCF2152329.1 hypothetical protein [Desmonostoc muscorum LEGE 12446]
MANTQKSTNEESHFGCFSGSQTGLLTQNTEKIDMDNEALSIVYIQPHDNPKSTLDVNREILTASSIQYKKSLLWKFRQHCKFWQPILGAIAAIVSLLIAVFKIML